MHLQLRRGFGFRVQGLGEKTTQCRLHFGIKISINLPYSDIRDTSYIINHFEILSVPPSKSKETHHTVSGQLLDTWGPRPV